MQGQALRLPDLSCVHTSAVELRGMDRAKPLVLMFLCVRACVRACMQLCVCHSFVIITLVLPQQTVILSHQTVGILVGIAIH